MMNLNKKGILIIVLGLSQFSCSTTGNKEPGYTCIKDREYSEEKIQAIVETAGGYKSENYECENNQDLAKFGDGFICSSANWKNCERNNSHRPLEEKDYYIIVMYVLMVAAGIAAFF